MKTLGALLIGIGLIMLIYKGINYTTEKKVVDLGPLQVKQEEKHSIPLSPIVGGIAVVGGIFLIGLASKKGNL